MKQMVIERPFDPVIVGMSFSRDKVHLRIGEPKPGETRVALLGPDEARCLAYALLLLAEEAREDRGAKSA